MFPSFLTAMSKQLFKFDPIPHEQNKLTDVDGKVVLGRWTTSVEDGKKVTIVFTYVLLTRLKVFDCGPTKEKWMDASWFPYKSKFQ